MAERLRTGGLEALDRALRRLPAGGVSTWRLASTRTSEVPKSAASVARSPTITQSRYGAGGEVAGLDEGRDLAVLHRGERAVVQAAAQVIAQGGGDRGGRAPEQVREEIEVVDGVGLRDAHVGARALEAGEAAGAVAHAARARPRRAARAARSSPGGSGRCARPGARAPVSATIAASAAALVHRERERLLDEAVAARAQALPGQGQVVVGRRHDVHRVHVRQRLAEVLDRARGATPACTAKARRSAETSATQSSTPSSPSTRRCFSPQRPRPTSSTFTAAAPVAAHVLRDLVAQEPVLHPAHHQEVHEGAHRAVADAVLGLAEAARPMIHRHLEHPEARAS